ncbi:MAG: right-handed parallel beta-helix repeat-containing protein [Bacteroidia bacterium]|nr:right-handed parallel beta-helix repeat-containing protein [Bacteroidia bacterium]
MDANAAAGPDNIHFNIPGTPPHVISITTALPNITGPVIIDGNTQPAGSYTGSAPKIIIDGGALGAHGLQITSANVQLIGLEVRNFGYSGIFVDGDPADNFLIERCVVRANSYFGIDLQGPDNGIIRGCVIGLLPDASACSANGYDGIQVGPGSNNNQILDNIIACNLYRGIDVEGAMGTIIRGNQIGMAGTSCVGNDYYCIEVKSGSQNTIIGGSASGQPNIITGGQYDGIHVDGPTTINNLISRNQIYCNAPPGGYRGIRLSNGGNGSIPSPVITTATTTTVSGTAPPNCTIEVFQAQDVSLGFCAGTDPDQGAVYLGTTTSNASGNWSLAGSFCGYVTATATNSSNNTSAFALRAYTGTSCAVPVNCVVNVLPLEIENFVGKYTHKGVVLSWELSNYQNFKKLYVQHSIDDRVWEYAEEVASINSQQSVETQVFREGVNYYRVVGVSKDGQNVYSRTIAIEVSDCKEKFEVYPSVVKHGEDIKIKNGKGYVRIYDSMGRLVFERELGASESINWSTYGASGGVYFIQTQNSTVPVHVIP